MLGFPSRRPTCPLLYKGIRMIALLARGLCTALLAAAAPTADWPGFHGPRRDNRSPETGLLKTRPDGGPPLLWTAPGLGKGYSTVAVVGDAIFTSGKVADETLVFALGLDDKLKWKARNGGAREAGPRPRWARDYDGARATPTVAGGRVFHLSGLGRLAAYDARTGRELWSLDLMPRYGYAESVLVADGRLFCYPGGRKGYAAALRPETGEVLWANTTLGEPASYCSAVAVEFGGERQIITLSARSVLGLRAADGRRYCLGERGAMALVEATPARHRIVGRFTVPRGGEGLYWAHPVVHGGRLYVRHADRLFAYDLTAP